MTSTPESTPSVPEEIGALDSPVSRATSFRNRGAAPADEKSPRTKVEVKFQEQEVEHQSDLFDTPLQFDALKEKLRPSYGQYFDKEQDYEYFLMLPIPDSKRAQFLSDAGAKATKQ